MKSIHDRGPLRSDRKQTSFETWRRVFLSFVVVSCGAASCDADPGNQAPASVEWPLGRSGKERVTLQLDGYLSPTDRAVMAADRGRPIYNGQIHEEMVLSALWPGMVTSSSDNRGDFNVAGGGRLMRVLVDSAAIEDWEGHHYDALQSIFDIALDRSVNGLCVGVMAQSHCYKREAADVKPAKYGLDRAGVDFAKYPDFPESDRSAYPERDIYYLRGPDGALQTVILCMAEEAKTVEDGPQYRMVAQCEQNYVNRRLNALVKISYRRVYLPEWRAIQESWDRVLLSSIVAPVAVAPK
jgi:hypothetical protein